jgi:hypothetical protein
MKQAKHLLTVAAAAALVAAAPGAALAESAVPNPGEFFSTTPEFDPTAGGTKYSGTLTIAYVFAPDANCPDSQVRIDNMHVVMTLSQGNNIKPFNTDFMASGMAPFCFIGESQQTQLVLGLIRSQVIPHFYNGCIPGSCPDFKVKSVTDFLSSGTGAISMNITIAVQ